jgi:hypothetical protein
MTATTLLSGILALCSCSLWPTGGKSVFILHQIGSDCIRWWPLSWQGKRALQTAAVTIARAADQYVVCCLFLQPRRVAAMSVAKRVSEEMGVDLGSEVSHVAVLAC